MTSPAHRSIDVGTVLINAELTPRRIVRSGMRRRIRSSRGATGWPRMNIAFNPSISIHPCRQKSRL